MNALKLLLNKSKSPRTDTLATIFYEEGNTFFKQQKYLEALKSYNKGLCHAKPKSVDLVNGFASRSTVYLEMEQYQHSLENIRLARIQTEYKNDTNLDKRESRCREYLKLNNIHDDTEDFFKLSYAPHRQIPFLANCLELGESGQFGRYIKTNRDLIPGDVVAIEEPTLIFTDLKTMSLYKYQRCFNCFKSNKLNLLPGPHSGN